MLEFNLHTIVRLPNGVFNPYTGIKTNLLFFEKGKATKEIWYFEHPLPLGFKTYNKTKPMIIEEFEVEKSWWKNRKESQFAWKVNIDEIIKRNFNLDVKNPNTVLENQSLSASETIRKLEESIGKSIEILKSIKNLIK